MISFTSSITAARAWFAHIAIISAAIDSIRSRLPRVDHFVALTETRKDWLDYETLLAASPAEFVRPEIRETDLLTINYTSGTTSRPKGVMITHRNAWMNTIGTLVHQSMSCADRYLWTLPMFHANGWTFVWTVTAAGATHICLRKVESARRFRIDGERADHDALRSADSLDLVSECAGELASRSRRRDSSFYRRRAARCFTIQRLEEELGWTITHAYGLTETAPFITVCEPRTEHASLKISERAAIKARQGVELITSGELRVVDEEGRRCRDDGITQGEIVARGNVIMAGYYNDPEATEQAMRGGWFHSGDAAVVHPDGYVEIRDRLKDVIISGGENISSIEVEGVLLRHPAVQEVAIVGLPHERWGEAPHAFVVLKQASARMRKSFASLRAPTSRISKRRIA